LPEAERATSRQLINGPFVWISSWPAKDLHGGPMEVGVCSHQHGIVPCRIRKRLPIPIGHDAACSQNNGHLWQDVVVENIAFDE